ncbi:low temperature requirement protein A [Phytohabitans sp. ZYX-F-186]|uniref:Low temperature requirement protein A n=1 Tax=Phytohabitans maris TaxID=3071409 RepID=A0ABU0ZDC9_9ACTN|nr:low temperature requirement protein A [Phytohabitans sp. ZYX-F-186]MDQ7905053.1 low temperature requirement protein A [Phytohabitans sp. ZYX-F-186]
MARARSGWVLRGRGDPRRISYLELLFDLGLIVALTRLSSRLTGDLGWNHALETVVLLAAIWWVWTVTAYTTNWYDPGLPLVQLIVLGVMFGGLLMSLAVSSAFEGPNGFAFAAAYVGLHLYRGLILVAALRGHALRRRPMRVLVWFCLTGVLWLVGAFLPGPARLVLWAVAVTTDFAVGLFGYPLPRLGRSSAEELRVGGEHLSERYRQMFIVTLGEIILVGVRLYGDPPFVSLRTAGVVLLFVLTVTMWRTYIVYVASHLAIGIDEATNPGRIGLVAAYAHLVMVAGVVLVAAGGDIVARDPSGPAHPAALAVVVAGPVVFLAGRAAYALVVLRAMLWRLPIGVVVLSVAGPMARGLPAIAVAAVMTAGMMAIAFVPHCGRPVYRTRWNIRTRW